MKHFKLIEHTADVRLYVEATTCEELFTVALQGMVSIVCSHQDKLEKDQACEIKIISSNITTLLIDFLSEVLTRLHTNNVLFCSITFLEFTETMLHVRLVGFKLDHFDEDVKAVTYHEAEVKKNKRGNYETIIVFDV
ncbi:MAG: archease [Candidatus Babeliales bacterium]|jgi:SHS2 domain-containing protein